MTTKQPAKYLETHLLSISLLLGRFIFTSPSLRLFLSPFFFIGKKDNYYRIGKDCQYKIPPDNIPMQDKGNANHEGNGYQAEKSMTAYCYLARVLPGGCMGVS